MHAAAGQRKILQRAGREPTLRGLNSINNLLARGSTPIHELVHFYDEALSHTLWHIGVVALSLLLLWPPSSGQPQSVPAPWAIVIPSAILYGFASFAASNEGGPFPFGLPAAVLVTLFLLIKARKQVRTNGLTAFFFLGYAFAILLFVIWFAIWQGLPQFSEAGLI